MKGKLLLISYHRIGTLMPKTIETSSFTVTLLEQVEKSGFVGEVKRWLAEFDHVIAYAGLDLFDSLAELMLENKDKLRLAACDCDQRRRIRRLNDLGMDEQHVFWTSACGGSQLMADLARMVSETDKYPVM